MPLEETNWDNEIFTQQCIDEIYPYKFIPEMEITKGFTKGHHLRTKRYINHISSYAPYLSELKKYVFTFKRDLLMAAKEKMAKYMHSEENSHSTFVSIHVRGSDYKKALGGLPAISDKYFSSAMKYFAKKYKVILQKNKF